MLQTDNLIFQCRDEFGRLNVYEDAGRRYLSFGNEVEQSCIDMHRPAHLCFQYTQMMLLGCLFASNAPQITLLGLGAGSLVQALLACLPDCRLIAVELRQQVVELAREYFGLPRDKRLKVRVSDAHNYLNRDPKAAELIFVDLYLEHGMDGIQARQDFLTACRLALKPGGLLVANYWLGDRLTSMAMNQTLEAVFEHPPLRMSTSEGNSIAFVFDGGLPRVDSKHFVRRAVELGRILDIPLHRYARIFMQQYRQLFATV